MDQSAYYVRPEMSREEKYKAKVEFAGFVSMIASVVPVLFFMDKFGLLASLALFGALLGSIILVYRSCGRIASDIVGVVLGPAMAWLVMAIPQQAFGFWGGLVTFFALMGTVAFAAGTSHAEKLALVAQLRTITFGEYVRGGIRFAGFSAAFAAAFWVCEYAVLITAHLLPVTTLANGNPVGLVIMVPGYVMFFVGMWLMERNATYGFAAILGILAGYIQALMVLRLS